MKVSVVIITLNRAKFLIETLKSLNYQTFKDFEIILVNGPSTDNTEEIAKQFPVKYFKNPIANVSISRNIGLIKSQGELICSIDDDAIPDKNWLQNIVNFYEEHKTKNIGAIAGTVFSADGNTLQFQNGFIDIWGGVSMIGPGNNFNDPKGYYFNTVIGVNSTYVRDALLRIGGFDEEIQYQHEESDVCVRLIKAGYTVLSNPKAIVYHKYAPSAIRDDQKVFTSWNFISKNSIYFAIKNSKDYAPLIYRIVKPLTIELGKFKQIWTTKFSLQKKISNSIELVIWMLKGYFRGHFSQRKLLKPSIQQY